MAPPAPPRQLAVWQLYMSKNKAGVDRVTEERRVQGNVPASRVLALRSTVSRELLAMETEEYREALRAECEQMIQCELAEYEATLEEPAAACELDQVQ